MFDSDRENWWQEQADAYTELMGKVPQKLRGVSLDDESETSS